MSPGPSTLLSALSCDTVGLCGNCNQYMEARKVDLNMKP